MLFMETLLTIIKWPFVVVCFVTAVRFAHWWWTEDTDSDKRYEYFQWVQFLVTMSGLALVATGVIWIFRLPEVIQSSFIQVAWFFILILRWPLIFISIAGAYWLIWWVFWDTEKQTPRGDKPEIMERKWDGKAPLVGLQIALIVTGFFLMAIFTQLPKATQEALLTYWDKEHPAQTSSIPFP